MPFEGTFEDFATADDDLLTTQPLTDADIVDAVTDKFASAQDDEDDDDEPESTARPAPSISAALDSCTVLREYLQSCPETQELFKHVNSLEDFLLKKQFRNKQQMTIRDFFVR